VIQVGDEDQDGVAEADGDCDDENPDIHPGRAEDCNAIDDNCNGLVDEGYPDSDVDGIADCQDTEECDGLDNDGDGDVDEGYPDSDFDGLADCVGEERCDGQDNDGDGEVDEGFDQDGDGVTSCEGDCDDTNALAAPGVEEVLADGLDNDCDGSVDESVWPVGAVQIVEVMVNPGLVQDRHGEWFEVFNTSTTSLTVNGLVLVSTVGAESHAVYAADPLTIEPGEYFVFGAEANQNINGGVVVDYAYEGISLSNESDEVQLVSEGVVVASLSWDDGATMPDPDGASISLDPVGYGAGVVADTEQWCAAVEGWGTNTDKGSPGSGNELCSTWDHDGDGYSGDDGDCVDTDATIWPGAPEVLSTVDNDCDGEVETMPVAVAGYDTTDSLVHCTEVSLDGTTSHDPDGNAVSYDWELTSAPSNSTTTTADIHDPSDGQPLFQPDVAGAYVLTLSVMDSNALSFPDSLSLDIITRQTNEEPTPDGGSDQSASVTSTCTNSNYTWTCNDCEETEFTLDGTNSIDLDGERLTYAWEVVSADGTATIDDPSSSAPNVIVSGPAADYGTANSETVILGLRVTDCYGATSQVLDEVALTVTCTGN